MDPNHYIDIYGNPHILLVDDQPQNIMLLGKILQKEAYSFALAENGEDAFLSIEQRTPDLILLDIMMPGLNGFEICRQLKSNPSTTHIPIIFLTAKVETEDKVRAFEAGAADYITKPFHASEVIARVRLHLREKASRDIVRYYNEKLETLLEKSTKDLLKSERQAALGQFAQGIVHNMKTPLSVIAFAIEYYDILREKIQQCVDQTPADKAGGIADVMTKADDLFEKSRLSFNKLNRMIENLMIKGRTDSNSEAEVVNLNDILNTELTFYESNIRFKHNVRREMRLCCNTLPVRAVPGDLSQIVENILGNALDALSQIKNPVIVIESGIRDNMAWFSITNNGPRVPDTIKERIFDPFFTTKKTEDKQAYLGGSGLGLHYCRETAHAYGGRILLDANDDENVRFVVEIPFITEM